MLSSYTPVHVGDTVWALIAEIDEAEAFAAIHALKYAMGIVAIFGVGVILILALVLSHVMVKPISYLATIADQLADGNIACDLDKLRRYVSHDEIGTLARSFEKLILYIQYTAAIATRIAQGNLSHTVRPRSKRDVLGQAFLNMSAYLESMATAATIIATGDFNYHIQPKTDEDALGNAFTKMTVQLRDNFERIQQEVTERQQAQNNLAEERNLLWTLIDHLPDWIYVKDTQGHFVIANTTIAQFVGAVSPNDLIGKQSHDLFPDEISEKFSADDRAVIESGQSLRNQEEQIVNHVTGTTSWILTTKVPFRDQHGKIVGLVGIDRDITERIQMEQRVRETERMAAIGRITASLSHEIRNPLSAIKMNLQLLKRNYQLVESARVHIDISVEEMMRLEGILSEILDFAKPLYPTLSECHINALLRSCLKLLQAKCDQKHLEVHHSFDESIPPVSADTEKLSQAVINLVLNAFEASEEGGQLWITSRYHPAEDASEAEVIVEDEGNGLNPEQLQDLFKPFFTTKAHGTGLGLTNARRIIETHGGRIDAENRLLRGASFHVYLPIA